MNNSVIKSVLVTSTGSVAADIVIKSLKRMKYRVVGCNLYPREWVVESCEVDCFYQIPPVSESSDYLEAIKRICVQEKITMILPMIDYEVDLFSKNRNWFVEKNIILCISPDYALDIIRNKKLLQDFVRDNCQSVSFIPTERIVDIDELKWSFPIVCKPYNGRSSQGLKIIYNNEEWKRFLTEFDVLNYIVEPFIDGQIVVVEIIRQDVPHKVIAITRKELIRTPHGCGITVCVYQDELLEKASKELADKLGVIGEVNFEYILGKDGKYYFIECNPRFSAGCEFACMEGYDCVENHLKCFLEIEIEDYYFKHDMIISRKYEEYITMIK